MSGENRVRRCLTQSKFSNIEIESIRRSYEDFLWYLKRKEIFIVIMIVIMGIVALDVYPPPFRIPVALSYPALPFCSFLHFSCRWYIYTYTCIHDLRIMYTYIYIYICIHQREDTIKKKKKNDAIYIYVYVRVPFPTRKAYLRLIMLNFLHNLYV